MTWVAVAIGGSALIGAGASYAGSKKQSDASKAAANLQMDQFGLINRQQQPFIQSGYGAMGRLNTLLGLSPNPNSRTSYPMSTPLQLPQEGPTSVALPGDRRMTIPEQAPNARLSQLLMLRAVNGDRQAQAMLRGNV